MIVECVARTTWEFDEDELFFEHAEDWENFMDGDIEDANDLDKEDFLRELFWEHVPNLSDIGGIETYDNYEIEFRLP